MPRADSEPAGKPAKVLDHDEKAKPTYDHLLPDSYDAVTSVYVAGRGWILIELTITDDKVTRRVVSEPEMKMIIMDRQKIAQTKLWKKISG